MPSQESTQAPIDDSKKSTVRSALYTGLIAGGAQATAFHPWDRALLLAQTAQPHARPFFHRDNWKYPAHNYLQSVGQRTITAGAYFTGQQMFSGIKTHMIETGYSEATANVALGTVAGTFTATTNNPFTYIRYVSWGPNNMSFTKSAKQLYQAGGLTIFTRGITPSLLRDGIYGAIYEYSRTGYKRLIHADTHQDPGKSFVANFLGASTAIFFTAPFNYVRNKIYLAPPNEPAPGVTSTMKSLFFSAKAHNTTSRDLGRYIARAMQIGPATVRFACGMALGQAIADRLKSDKQDTENRASTPSPRSTCS